MTLFSDLVTRAQLEKEFQAVGASYRIIEAKNFWTDADRRRWSELGMRYTDLRKAIAQHDAEDEKAEAAIAEDEKAEAAMANGQFGVGA